jgi:hypothetical protein
VSSEAELEGRHKNAASTHLGLGGLNRRVSLTIWGHAHLGDAGKGRELHVPPVRPIQRRRRDVLLCNSKAGRLANSYDAINLISGQSHEAWMLL